MWVPPRRTRRVEESREGPMIRTQSPSAGSRWLNVATLKSPLHFPTFENGEVEPPWGTGWCAPRGIRILVLALRGPRPGPLDDGGVWRLEFYHA